MYTGDKEGKFKRVDCRHPIGYNVLIGIVLDVKRDKDDSLLTSLTS